MDEPQWIAEGTALRIHEEQLERHGGLAGVRDAGLLKSALHRPLNLWKYEGQSIDLASLAAAYAVGIARNHPFIDGNKRTAAVACETFLELNGRLLTATDDQWYQAMIGVASGTLSDVELATWIRSYLVPC